MNETIQPATDEEIAILWALEFVARIRADEEQIAELKRDFEAYRAAMNPDDDAAYQELVHKPLAEWKRRAEAAEARAARLAEALRFMRMLALGC